MRAAVVRTLGGGFGIADVDLAEPRGHEVVVEVRAVGLCHTDLTMSRHGMGNPPPAVFGHEVAGVVSAVGPDVAGLAVGDHVVGGVVRYCGECARCVAGRVYQCLQPEAVQRAATDAPRLSLEGVPVTQAFGIGGFAELALVHEHQLVEVSDAMPFVQAALLGCSVATGAGSVLNAAQLGAGDSMVVVGVGGVGLNAISGGVIAGAGPIIAVDVADEKLEKARRFGATHTVNSTRVDPVTAVRQITAWGADAVFDLVGASAVTAQALEMAGPGGGLYVIGVADPSAELTLPLFGTMRSQKRVQGVYLGSTAPKRDIPAYAELYLEGRLNLDDLVSAEIALDEIDAGYEAMQDAAVTRVVVTRF
jgi:S-(hydroxymethyl)glutathione dehydrogenase/alcohol dehydrogenase